jgi:5-methylcytosine-specific restriction endonuclease McrA
MPRKTTKVPRCCKKCGDQFFVLQSVVDKGLGVFCSRDCYLISSGKSPARPKVQRTCKQCGKEFLIRPRTADSGKGIFCSPKCWKESPKPAPIVTCGCCGKVFADPGRYRPKYCSPECYQNSRPKAAQFPARPHEHDTWALAVILRDKKCVRCGDVENLQAHHLKEWKDYPDLRFVVSNGVALCPLCHHAQHPYLPLERFVASGGKKVQYCVVCEAAFLVRKKTQRVCSRQCGWARKKQEAVT